MKKKSLLMALLAGIALSGAGQAALLDRDLNGDTLVDAFYDTHLNITWLRDADVNGPMNWDAAMAWATDYSIGGYSDWRLPTSDTCVGMNCTGSEMGHLWYVELGNEVNVAPTEGNFQNLETNFPTVYWSSTPFGAGVMGFYTSHGFQGDVWTYAQTFAMAVHTGDIGIAVGGNGGESVPEPGTLLLLGLGLGGLIAARRRVGQ